jgi:RHS repeat-associated protein
MMGRYNGDGSLLEETVWLGDLPVAVLAPGAQYFVAPDHLGAPHQITDSGGNVVWFWDHDPFGNGAPTGTFGYNLRFPGQFYDQQTGLHYNYYRDYDPAKGRYLESDPIGLAGGTNTYAYVGSSPVNGTDSSGKSLVSELTKLLTQVLDANRKPLDQNNVVKVAQDVLDAKNKLNTKQVEFAKNNCKLADVNKAFNELKEKEKVLKNYKNGQETLDNLRKAVDPEGYGERHGFDVVKFLMNEIYQGDHPGQRPF